MVLELFGAPRNDTNQFQYQQELPMSFRHREDVLASLLPKVDNSMGIN